MPSVIGGASAGSRSTIPTGNYFDDTTRHSRRMVAARKVVCPKGKCGDQGSRDYSQHHSAATAAIPELFGAAKHFCTKNADGERNDDDRKPQKKGDGWARRLIRSMTMRLLASADSVVCSSIIVDGKQLGYNVRMRIDKVCI